MSFEIIADFEKAVSKFFGAPYAVAVDSCTHGIELCLRYTGEKKINVPKRTYLSVPFLAEKMGLERQWRDEEWQDYYTLNYGDRKIIDAAVLWKKDSYIPNTFMCLSFQYQKHLSIGRGGMILCDNEKDYIALKKMSYDGRLPNIPWRDQNIDMVGYHYYMTPESAQIGLSKLEDAIKTEPRKWVYTDWPDLTKMKVFDDTQLSTLEYCEKHKIDPYLQTK
jgi:dTDP-4-amino-4,6-dideoxygalactose transaminase